MIEFLFGMNRKEAEAFIQVSRLSAAKYSEEKWNYYICENSGKILEFLKKNALLDMACLDITLQYGIQTAEQTRRQNNQAFLVLVADNTIPPMKYIRPAIKAGALLIKPYQPSDVRQILEESIKSYLNDFYNQEEDSQFCIESRDGRQVISYNKIFYFEAREKKIYLNIGTKEIAFYDTIDHLEQTLPKDFLRCHRSFIVAKRKIDRIFLSQNLILLKEGYSVPLSRSYKQNFKELKS